MLVFEQDKVELARSGPSKSWLEKITSWQAEDERHQSDGSKSPETHLSVSQAKAES